MSQKKEELNLELNSEVAKGSYSNLAIITHSSSEFILDFARMLPGVPKAEVTNRVIMTPEHAKRLFLALRDNLSTYEEQFGEIKLCNNQKGGGIPIDLDNNTAQA